MDDFNKAMQQQRREQARDRAARLAADAAAKPAEGDASDRPAPEGAGRLVLERRQGEWRYFLAGERIQGGDAVELYVDARVGWIAGRFQWGRRNTSAPTIRVPTHHPDDPSVSLGELEISLPADALCRWPLPA